jgi:hypothetical protein
MMRRLLVKTTISIGVVLMTLGFAMPCLAQDKPTNNLEVIHEKLKADKKLIVTKYMDLQKLNERLGSLLQSYAAEYRSNSLSDEKAKKLLDEWLALDKDEANHRKSYAGKVLKVLPAKKAARYLQIENEFRVLLKYDLAATVPLVQ